MLNLGLDTSPDLSILEQVQRNFLKQECQLGHSYFGHLYSTFLPTLELSPRNKACQPATILLGPKPSN